MTVLKGWAERWSRAALVAAIAALCALCALESRALAQTQRDASAKRKPAAVKAAPKRAITLKRDLTMLASFVTAPFPYEGVVPATGKMFLDVEEGERRGHRGARGQVYWADETYDDSRVLLHLPKGFNAQKPGMLVVFFHGHGATLERDVMRRQQVAAQISRAGINAALIAPQFARDAADSSPGKFWEPGRFFWFMEEAAQQLAALYGDQHAVRLFDKMPIVFVAYSGGYQPAAFAIQNSGIGKRVRAVLLLDALYGDLDKYTNWILRHRSGVFVSAFTHHTAERNADMQKVLKDRNILFETEIKKPLLPGTLAFVQTGPEILHRDYVTEAWTDQPVREFLKALTIKP